MLEAAAIVLVLMTVLWHRARAATDESLADNSFQCKRTYRTSSITSSMLHHVLVCCSLSRAYAPIGPTPPPCQPANVDFVRVSPTTPWRRGGMAIGSLMSLILCPFLPVKSLIGCSEERNSTATKIVEPLGEIFEKGFRARSVGRSVAAVAGSGMHSAQSCTSSQHKTESVEWTTALYKQIATASPLLDSDSRVEMMNKVSEPLSSTCSPVTRH